MLPRDQFIESLLSAAKKDKNIFFLCADLGAKSLDNWRRELPEQFIHVGICEQNMIDVAAGLAQNGKKVFVYAMASFITLRCLEQIKVSLSIMNLPVTILGVGVGYGYENAGPTHYALEDISALKCLPHLEILSPCDSWSIEKSLHLCLNFPALRYLRLERKAGPIIYGQGNLANMGARESAENGLGEIHRGKGLAIVTHGFMHQRAIEILDYFKNKDFDFGLIDTFCISPWNLEKNRSLLTQYDFFISLEEHFLPGGIGSSLLEALSDLGLNSKVLRLGICNQYFFENGGREYIHKLSGIDLMTCISKIEKFLKSNL